MLPRYGQLKQDIAKILVGMAKYGQTVPSFAKIWPCLPCYVILSVWPSYGHLYQDMTQLWPVLLDMTMQCLTKVWPIHAQFCIAMAILCLIMSNQLCLVGQVEKWKNDILKYADVDYYGTIYIKQGSIDKHRIFKVLARCFYVLRF